MPETETTILTPTMPPPQTALAKAEPPPKVPVRLGIAIATLDEAWRLAQMMAKSSIVPESFRNQPENVLVAIQMGAEIGFAPMQALQSIAVINGRPSVWGDGFLALLMSAPVYQDHDEYYEVQDNAVMVRRDGLTAGDLTKDTTAAVCTFWRKGKALPVTRRFSIAQAKKASLLTKKGPWQEYPDRMLSLRARAFAGRDTFPDVLRGIGSAEEVSDIIEAEAIIEAAPRTVQRISEAPRREPEPERPAPFQPVTVGPIGVKDVENTLQGWQIILANGEQVEADAKQASALDTFCGTGAKVILTCEATGPIVRLVSFAIAE